MKPRERIKAALDHRATDILPVDFGASPVTGIAASLIFQLREKLGLERRAVKIVDPFQMLGEIDDELKEYLQTDVACILPRQNAFGIENKGWREWRLFDGTPVLVPGGLNTGPDASGNIFAYPQGDRTAAPSAVMPRGGYYFDALIRQKPIDEARLDVADNLEEFTLLEDEELRYIETETDRLYRETDSAIIGLPGGTALGDIAKVPGLGLKDPRGIRDIEEWYISTIARKSYLKELFDRQTDIALQNLEMYRQAVGDKIAVIYLCGNDFGTQNALFCSVELYRDLYLPYYQKMTAWIHNRTNWKVFKHSCGAIEPLIESMIESGFDILNPVQCSATGMDPAALKEKYGCRITFWGGGVNTQKTLPFGTPEEVRREVRERIGIFSLGGGYVFNTIHNVQAKIPVENFMTMVETIKEFRVPRRAEDQRCENCG
ncbi:MAG: uroporphyrinogen decarboxylase family protein [Bacillota bacterium]